MLMKQRAFLKSGLRTVRSTFPRFLSILIISFLGAGIFAGLAAVAPNMRERGDAYMDEYQVADVRLASAYGFSEEDVEAILNTDEVNALFATYSVDSVGTVDGKDYTFRLTGLPDGTDSSTQQGLNQLSLQEGHYPEAADEALIVLPSIGLKNITLGSTVTLNTASNEDISSQVSETTYTIVGIAASPYYLYFSQGTTSIGSGMINYVLYIPSETFTMDVYTDVFVTFSGLSQENAFSDTYKSQLQTLRDPLDTLAGEREGLRQAELEDELSQAQEDYAAQKEAFNTQLEQAAALLGTDSSQYLAMKEEGESALSDAKEQIEEAQNTLERLGKGKWYVLDRFQNDAFYTFYDATNRMESLATVFPVIFFLVAALVCLTTMTRMVDEDRILIGSFKALGYGNGSIGARYLLYAAAASVLGSLLGVMAGFQLLPSIVWNAYGIIFTLPALTPAFYPVIALGAILTTGLTTTFATGFAVVKALREAPASLMRPKAPPKGKRVLPEYIPFLWKRLSFTRKVTIRNLGLNKKRMLMTLAGVMGCTALLVTAFGTRNAIINLLDKQFGRIFHFDVSVSFSGDTPSDALTTQMEDEDTFTSSLLVLQKTAYAGLTEDADKTYSVSVISPETSSALSDYITLFDTSGKNTFSLQETDVIITQKLSMNLDIGVGDTICLQYLDDSAYYPVTITGIAQNFAFNYIYVGSEAYASFFGEAPDYNQFFALRTEGVTDDDIQSQLSTLEDVGAVSFQDNLMGNLRTTMQSINAVIWILLVAAALLAFVVLYNLTNINIGERQRDLATLKVLGFYDKETYSYIYRETIVLSILGCALGLYAGIYLYRAVVRTVEPEMVYLTRQLTWQGFLGAAALTMLFTILVNQALKPRIRHINMLESLKSVD